VVAVLAAVGVAALMPGLAQAPGLRLSAGLPLTAAGVLAGLNLGFVRLARGTTEAGEGRSVGPLLWAQIVADLLVLTAVIHWLGSGLAAAPFMYLFHVILACIVFTPGASLGVAGLAAALYLALLSLESWGVLDTPGAVWSAARAETAGVSARGVLAWHALPMLLIWAVIWYLVSRLATALRSRDRALYVSNLRLRASIEERSNHMLQTTHQLKAPFAAIHAQTQLLLGGYCGVLPEKVAAVVGKISERCLVLSRQIQEMLQLANLRSQGQTAPPRREVQFDRLIEETLARVEPAAQQRGIRLDRQLEPVRVVGVADHLTMLVDNLVVNAVNYSHPQAAVRVACQSGASGGAVFVVRDEGIGIPREKLPHIFEDYYRTEEAVRHNRASTGLGLAIVRQVACGDHFDVQVESAPGWGTRFTVTIPGATTGTPAAPTSSNRAPASARPALSHPCPDLGPPSTDH
jgi:signal transduction histidine kinase